MFILGKDCASFWIVQKDILGFQQILTLMEFAKLFGLERYRKVNLKSSCTFYSQSTEELKSQHEATFTPLVLLKKKNSFKNKNKKGPSASK